MYIQHTHMYYLCHVNMYMYRYVTHVSFSPDGHYFATCSNDKTIKVWKVKQHDDSTNTSQG